MSARANCTFCAVSGGTPLRPISTNHAAWRSRWKDLGLAYAVITSVTRDDLPDGGALNLPRQFVRFARSRRNAKSKCSSRTSAAMKKAQRWSSTPAGRVESQSRNCAVALPEGAARGGLSAFVGIAKASLRFRPRHQDRPDASAWARSRKRFRRFWRISSAFNCRRLTLGQYLRPSPNHHPIIRYVHPTIRRLGAKRPGDGIPTCRGGAAGEIELSCGEAGFPPR